MWSESHLHQSLLSPAVAADAVVGSGRKHTQSRTSRSAPPASDSAPSLGALGRCHAPVEVLSCMACEYGNGGNRLIGRGLSASLDDDHGISKWMMCRSFHLVKVFAWSMLKWWSLISSFETTRQFKPEAKAAYSQYLGAGREGTQGQR